MQQRLSILDENGSLNIEETIAHAENIIKKGLHGVFLFWLYRTKSINFNG